MGRRLVFLATLLGVMAVPRSAAADITAFLGITSTPENHGARGLAVGLGLVIIGFEGEYANISQSEEDGLPGLQTYSGNILLQTPVEISGVQLYGTAGGGMYRERLLARQETHFASNLGGGAKIRLFGPLRVRVDYRVFRLHGDPLHQTYQRFYVGANVTF